MSSALAGTYFLPEPIVTPTIEWGIAGPHQQTGFLLRVPRVESLVWDLENEITTVRRHWWSERSAWWIEASFLDTAVEIVLRAFPSVLLIHGPDGDRLYSRDGFTVFQERLL